MVKKWVTHVLFFLFCIFFFIAFLIFPRPLQFYHTINTGIILAAPGLNVDVKPHDGGGASLINHGEEFTVNYVKIFLEDNQEAFLCGSDLHITTACSSIINYPYENKCNDEYNQVVVEEVLHFCQINGGWEFDTDKGKIRGYTNLKRNMSGSIWLFILFSLLSLGSLVLFIIRFSKKANLR
ncbi:hypothetical protein AYK26_00465 [Euryarchaeota archaeon SM23-78]|nr:MAG: hypothetical protein AYK26_00465 [Euryarchaeota archaeon SM23-78]MBW3001332.1 hypothetical protein [Candidatus Woesearchaeota archaeon]